MVAKAKKNNKNERKIGLLRFPFSRGGEYQLKDMVEVIKPSCNELVVLSGNDGFEAVSFDEKVEKIRVDHVSGNNRFSQILFFLFTQLRLALRIVKNKQINTWFFMGGDILILPLLFCKLTGKKVALITMSSIWKTQKYRKRDLSDFTKFFSRLGHNISDVIVVYTENLISEWGLEEYRNKVMIAHKHKLNFNTFKLKKNIDERKNIIGFVGSLTKRKNVMSLIQAAKKVRNSIPNTEFWIIGEGPKRESITKYIENNNMEDYIKLFDWVPHEELPNYLNEMKLFVLPTYHEGLPNAVLEAMACGTPVLASPVDGIPDIIEDGKTGFLLSGKTPNAIYSDIINILDKGDLNTVSNNANEYLKENFKPKVAIEQHKRVIKELEKNKKYGV